MDDSLFVVYLVVFLETACKMNRRVRLLAHRILNSSEFESLYCACRKPHDSPVVFESPEGGSSTYELLYLISVFSQTNQMCNGRRLYTYVCGYHV